MIGSYITQRRKEQGLSQAELARLSGHLVSTTHGIENGDNQNPRFEITIDLCKTLNVSLDDLRNAFRENLAEKKQQKRKKDTLVKSHVRNDALDLTKTIWDLCLLNTLHDDFGFGEKRLKQFYKKLEETQNRFSEFACATVERYTNIDSAVIRLLVNLDNIDYKNILGIDEILMNGKNLTQIAERINSRK